jgi:hypothetical protein
LTQHTVPRLQDSIADKAMHYLLLYDLAECAAALYAAAEQHKKQQDMPNAHHVQLLQQLGLGGLQLKADRSIQRKRAMYAMHHIMTASKAICNLLSIAASGSNTGGSSSSSSIVGAGAAGVPPLPAAAAGSEVSSSSCGPLEAAAMQTLMQCTLLPIPGEEATWFHNATHMLWFFLEGLPASACTAAAAVMLQPFVTRLLPAGLSALKAAAAAAAAAAATTGAASSTVLSSCGSCDSTCACSAIF